jgi:hypothetical protein
MIKNALGHAAVCNGRLVEATDVPLITEARTGIITARADVMPIDILALLRRDHEDLSRGIDALLSPDATIAQIRTALDGARLGLTAHAEAEDIVFAHAVRQSIEPRALALVVEEASQAHKLQEVALASLVCAPVGTAGWYDSARWLGQLIVDHAAYEEKHVLPAIRDLAPVAYSKLAGRFATERLRQLSMMAPSAPMYLPEAVRRIANARR